ncbi:MAG: hypothetical protein KGL39_55035 [Patescibacteria group bacterium]|nr:hypothetical protein [Patescibacteria group bacterium]
MATKQDGSTVKAGPPPKFKRPLYDSKIFVITAAQNATPVHQGFWDSLLRYCEDRNAELLVVPIRYKNATSVFTESQKNAEWWLDPPAPHYDIRSEEYRNLTEEEYNAKVYPKRRYLWNVRRKLNDNLILLGDIRTQPTAAVPLQGFESITHSESGILAHTKVQLKTVPTLAGKLPKILTTTGAVTVRNYTDTKAGKLGEFHHTLGAVVVEIQSPKIFHLRQINADKDTGGFYDIPNGVMTYYQPSGWGRSSRQPLGIVLGDMHLRNADPDALRATLEEIIPELDPQEVILHDLDDGETVNHHTERDPFVGTARSFAGRDKVEAEVNESFDFVATLAQTRKIVIAPSNHNDWLHGWIKFNDWRTMSPKNRSFYLRTALAMQEAAETLTPDQAERLNAFIELAKKRFAQSANVDVLDYDESHKLADIECGLHGHLGPNGSRGTARNYARIGVKTIAGDCHSPEIFEGSWRAGTLSRLIRGYNKGPSGWLHTNVLVYPNGKRTMIHIINGEWRV